MMHACMLHAKTRGSCWSAVKRGTGLAPGCRPLPLLRPTQAARHSGWRHRLSAAGGRPQAGGASGQELAHDVALNLLAAHGAQRGAGAGGARAQQPGARQAQHPGTGEGLTEHHSERGVLTCQMRKQAAMHQQLPPEGPPVAAGRQRGLAGRVQAGHTFHLGAGRWAASAAAAAASAAAVAAAASASHAGGSASAGAGAASAAGGSGTGSGTGGAAAASAGCSAAWPGTSGSGMGSGTGAVAPDCDCSSYAAVDRAAAAGTAGGLACCRAASASCQYRTSRWPPDGGRSFACCGCCCCCCCCC